MAVSDGFLLHRYPSISTLFQKINALLSQSSWFSSGIRVVIILNEDIVSTAASRSMTGFRDLSVAYVAPPFASGCTYTETTKLLGRLLLLPVLMKGLLPQWRSDLQNGHKYD
jgi:hypothetical protein